MAEPPSRVTKSRRLMGRPQRGSHPTTPSYEQHRCASQQIRRAMSQLGRCCRKSRKSKDAENLANGEFWTTPPLRCSVVLIRRSVVVFLRHNVVPHVATHETHQQL